MEGGGRRVIAQKRWDSGVGGGGGAGGGVEDDLDSARLEAGGWEGSGMEVERVLGGSCKKEKGCVLKM